MTLEEAEQAAVLGVGRLTKLHAAADAASDGYGHLNDAAFVSRFLREAGERMGNRVGDAVERARRAFLRELYHEGIITREEAGLRAARRSRIG